MDFEKASFPLPTAADKVPRPERRLCTHAGTATLSYE